MNNRNPPPISEALVAYVKMQVPRKAYTPTMTAQAILFEEGKQSVVDALVRMYEVQEER